MIETGDYICSDFFSPIQGFVVGNGVLGKNIPCYKIKMLDDRIEYVIKGQANLLWTKEEWDNPAKRACHYPRHD